MDPRPAYQAHIVGDPWVFNVMLPFGLVACETKAQPR